MTDSEILIKACELMDKRFAIGEKALKEYRPLTTEELKQLDQLSDEMANLRKSQVENR